MKKASSKPLKNWDTTSRSDITSLEKRIAAIESRNRRVEIDKAWEGSALRRILIAVFTFVGLGAYMWYIGVDQPLVNAVVPTLGFTLSTLTLPTIKKWYSNKQK